MSKKLKSETPVAAATTCSVAVGSGAFLVAAATERGRHYTPREISKSVGKRLVRFRNCFCGVQAVKFYDGQFLCQRHFEADRARYQQDPKVTEANIKACNARCEKERYARLKAAGLCVTCGKRESYDGCIRCHECQSKRRAYHHAYRGKKRGGVHPIKIANNVFFSQFKNPPFGS